MLSPLPLAFAILALSISQLHAQLSDAEILDNTIPEEADDLQSASVVSVPATSSSLTSEWVKITKFAPAQVPHPYGTVLELECEATGSPAPTITWVRGHQADPIGALDTESANTVKAVSIHSLVRVRSRLTIERHDPQATQYSCVASAGGQSATATTTINTALRPSVAANGLDGGELATRTSFTLYPVRAEHGLRKPRIVSYYSVVFEHMGNNLFLPCQTIGSPAAEIHWLDSSDRVISNASGTRLHVTKLGTLVIEDLQWADMGVFRCVAKSPVGKDVVSTFVYPMLGN